MISVRFEEYWRTFEEESFLDKIVLLFPLSFLVYCLIYDEKAGRNNGGY